MEWIDRVITFGCNLDVAVKKRHFNSVVRTVSLRGWLGYRSGGPDGGSAVSVVCDTFNRENVLVLSRKSMRGLEDGGTSTPTGGHRIAHNKLIEGGRGANNANIINVDVGCLVVRDHKAQLNAGGSLVVFSELELTRALEPPLLSAQSYAGRDAAKADRFSFVKGRNRGWVNWPRLEDHADVLLVQRIKADLGLDGVLGMTDDAVVDELDIDAGPGGIASANAEKVIDSSINCLGHDSDGRVAIANEIPGELVRRSVLGVAIDDQVFAYRSFRWIGEEVWGGQNHLDIIDLHRNASFRSTEVHHDVQAVICEHLVDEINFSRKIEPGIVVVPVAGLDLANIVPAKLGCAVSVGRVNGQAEAVGPVAMTVGVRLTTGRILNGNLYLSFHEVGLIRDDAIPQARLDEIDEGSLPRLLTFLDLEGV
mmetsp:Transcript_16093/g.46380  ORF Transcript_16093/g.46380 Transcript_16093/m.46380 type:complete len:423 (+) Transcript_16093:3462-4730(+)